MTRRLGDLENLVQSLRNSNGTLKEKVTLEELKITIGRKFGTSPFVQRSVIDELSEFKLISPSTENNVYKIHKIGE